jgi:drug/metabolite transporter (DMT)-like permease
LYSLGGIFSKLASRHPFFSLPFFIFYGLVLLILVIYAFFWQQILKKIALNIAFSNKGIIVLWNIMWGNIFFHEKIKINMIIGIMFILLGIFFLVYSSDGKNRI